MQFEQPMQNHRFDSYYNMNSDKFTFPNELPFPLKPTDDSFESEHKTKIAMPIIPQAEPKQLLSSPNYQPTRRDIICGRGRGSFLHEGNKVYLSLLRKNINAYMSARKRNEKSTIISSIVSSLKETGFRFLKQGENKEGWYELSKTESYERTAHAIRDLIRKQRRKSKTSSASRSSVASDSDSSVSTEKTDKETVNQNSEALEIDMSALPLPTQVFTNNDEPLPLDTSDQQTDKDSDSFDELICEIPSEVMSPTDTLKTTGAFDIFFEITQNDFETILVQLDTDKQTRRASNSSH